MKGRKLLSSIVVVVVLVTVATAAHFSGVLNPIYHSLGLHALVHNADVDSTGMPHSGHSAATVWTCPMHPQIRSDRPGTCPICNMDLVPINKTATGAEPSAMPGYAKVTITPERQQLIGVRTAQVKKDKLLMSIRAVGIIEPDQRRLAHIHTRVNGWVNKLHVDFVGQSVEKGAPLLEIYSPELLSSQNAYLIARSGVGVRGAIGQNDGVIDAARKRLELLGVAPEEIAELDRTGRARDTLLLRSPIAGTVLERNVLEGSYVEPQIELYRIADLSVVWVQAKIYEYELPHIEVGQPVVVTVQSQPQKEFSGKVTFVDPVVQEATRTVNVRVEIKNDGRLLKPGMYADLKIEHDMGTGLLMPESAVLRTGERAVSFRVLPENRFEPVEVKLGGRFGDNLQVLSGLKDGDTVVASAGFLIDSESRLKATMSGSPGGHKHGG
jgi:Cu(I)/Ag(I) efflux system membrane fusion protein